MTLSTIQRPFAAYSFGEAVTKGGRTAGLASGFLYRAQDGEVCVVSRTPAMGAPAFYSYPTLLAAWRAYRAGRDQQVGSPAAAGQRLARIERLRAELARLDGLE